MEIRDASPEVADIVRRLIRENRTGNPDYELRTAAGAFLQGDSPGWILVEFWDDAPDAHQAFVDRVNVLIDEARKRETHAHR